MNPLTVRKIGFFMLGASIGGTIGYILGKVLIPDEILYYINGKQVSKAEYNSWYFQVANNYNPNAAPREGMTVGVDMGEKPVVLDEKKMRAKKPQKIKPTDYSKMANKAPLEEVAKEKLSDDVKAARKDGPYIVSLEEHTALRSNYGSEILTYYEEDDVLVNEQEEIISDPASMIGDNALMSFGEQSDDEDMVYVRNERVGMDYEIIRSHKSYAEMVAGFVPETKKPPSRNSRKTRKVKASDADEGDD